jgi:hypothetical protein
MSYILLEKYHTGSATDLNNDFYHVGQGSLMPLGSTSLEPTTGVYNLGSSATSWNNAYVNTINLGSGTVNRCMNMIAEVTLTATASSIEFTGLNGETDVIYEVNCNIVGYASGTVYMYPNSDSATNNYGYHQLYAENTVLTASRGTSISGMFLGIFNYDTTSAKYTKSSLIMYANNNLKLCLIKINENVGNTYIKYLRIIPYVWNNSATLTSMKFTGYFDPGTHIEIWAKR